MCTLPAPTEAVAALRWDGAAGGGDAAPWIHLFAVTLAIYVVVPRLLLAAAVGLGELRRRFAGGMPIELVPYARRVFGAPGRGLRNAVVAVMPYAYEPPQKAMVGLERLLDEDARRRGPPGDAPGRALRGRSESRESGHRARLDDR